MNFEERLFAREIWPFNSAISKLISKANIFLGPEI